MAKVAIVMGSDSDWEYVQTAAKVLDQFDIDCEVRVMSAHRTPHAVAEFAQNAENDGIKVFIAAAGGAAHLAGSTIGLGGIQCGLQALNTFGSHRCIGVG